MRKFLIFLVLLALPIIIVCHTLRLKGLNQAYQAHDHPLNQKSLLKVAYQGASLEAPPNSALAIELVHEADPEMLIWIDVNQTKDGVFVLYEPDMLQESTNGQGLLPFTNWREVKNLDAAYKFQKGKFRGRGMTIQRLDDVLKKYPEKNFVINLKANHKKIDLEFSDFIEEHNASRRILVTSSIGIVVQSLRKISPLWFYGLESAEYTRLTMFTSIGMGPVIPLKGDIFISPSLLHNKTLSAETVKELQRRKKKVVVYADGNLAYETWKKKVTVDGVLSRDINFLRGVR